MNPGRDHGRPPVGSIRSVRLLAELEIADRDLGVGDRFLWPAYACDEGAGLQVETWRIVEVLDPEVDDHLQRVLAEPVEGTA